jgi:hypothetical protein
MKKGLVILLLVSVSLSCTHNDKKSGNGSSVPAHIKKEIMNYASSYFIGKLKEPKKIVSPDGIVTIKEDQISYVIDPAKIYAGLIDDDTKEDAIISIDYYHGQYLVLTDHLILINTNGKLILNREIESDMRILGIKERIITAEIYTKSRNSPLADCSHCKEVVKYRFKAGELVKAE